MANALYPKYRDRQLEGSSPVQWLAHNIVVILVGDTQTYDAADEFVADLVDVVATSGNLTGKTAVDGVADADDVTFTALTGSHVAALVIARDTGSAATSPLMVWIDTKTNASPVDITPDGNDVTLTWSNGTTKIFRL